MSGTAISSGTGRAVVYGRAIDEARPVGAVRGHDHHDHALYHRARMVGISRGGNVHCEECIIGDAEVRATYESDLAADTYWLRHPRDIESRDLDGMVCDRCGGDLWRDA